jgi:L-2,4-diaminobutyric acid acetyltransferase
VTRQIEAPVDIPASPALSIRTANLSDGAAIWKLVDSSEALDANSCYAYLLLVSDFADTCLVSYDGERLAGFVAAYVPPKRPEVVFVWQIGVDARYRGCGLGRRLLHELVARTAKRGVRYLEATVTPGNQPSQRLFRSLAASGGWELTASTHFGACDFAGTEHEAEELIRIGSFTE